MARKCLKSTGLILLILDKCFGVTLTILDDRYDYGEKFASAHSDCSTIVEKVVAHTEDDGGFGISPQEKLQEMKKRDMLKKSKTDWDRLKGMKDEEIDLSESPEIEPKMFPER
ncbi:MAG: hypothetical protein IPO77_02340 [Acidobacteria bacterium]|nr:hypothetical protein [Acidobacteriota bacterium]